MINIHRIGVLFFVVFFLSSCNLGETKMNTIDVGGLFTVDLPEYMVELDLGNPYANIEYGNMMKEHYVTILREAKTDFLFSGVHMDVDYYAEIQLEVFEASLTYPVVNELASETINGLKTKNVEVNGVFTEEDIAIYYNFMFYESETALYTLVTWTLAELERTHKEDMYKIANSLKEL